jgi:hypothetical protein
MKALLIKENGTYFLKGDGIPNPAKLNLDNCDEIFSSLAVDVDKLADEECLDDIYAVKRRYKKGFNKAMELNKDKVFTESDIFSVVNHILAKLVKVDGFDQKYLFPEEVYQEVTWKTKQIQQPTEIEVEIEMFRGNDIKSVARDWDQIGEPKLDSNGCLILKKK